MVFLTSANDPYVTVGALGGIIEVTNLSTL